MTYTVTLKAVGNPDFGQFFGAGVMAPTERRTYPSIQECQRATQDYITKWNLGGGNWVGGDVRSGKKRVGRIAYNGTFIPDTKEAR